MSQIVWKIAGVGGAALAGMVARKVISATWEKTTHRPAPVDPNRGDIKLSEALAWTIVSGVGIAVAQLLVERATANVVRKRMGEAALPEKLRTAVE